MIAVIDNYDSFTYNLVQYLGELGAVLEVFRNDAVTVEELDALDPTHIVISPGPGVASAGPGERPGRCSGHAQGGVLARPVVAEQVAEHHVLAALEVHGDGPLLAGGDVRDLTRETRLRRLTSLHRDGVMMSVGAEHDELVVESAAVLDDEGHLPRRDPLLGRDELPLGQDDLDLRRPPGAGGCRRRRPLGDPERSHEPERRGCAERTNGVGH